MTPHVDLPPRPRLGRPAWRRGPDAIQFGTRAERALVLDGLTPPLVRMLTGLDGTRSTARVLADAVAAGVAPDAACAALRELHAAGLLAEEHPGAPVRARGVVVVHGAGRIGVALACLLAGAGVGRVRVAGAGPVRARDTGTGLRDGDVGRPATDAAAEAVVRAGGAPPGEARAARRATARPDVVVLAAGRHPDPVVAAELVAAGRAHLVVAVDDDTLGVVGPLVVPGRTPCLRCEDLARAEVDPAWPRVAAELAGSRPEVPVATAAAVAAVAADHVLTLLDAGSVDLPARDRPASLGAVLVLDPRRGSWRREAREAHPGCGCGARATAPVVAAAPAVPAVPAAPAAAAPARVAVVAPAGVGMGGAA